MNSLRSLFLCFSFLTVCISSEILASSESNYVHSEYGQAPNAPKMSYSPTNDDSIPVICLGAQEVQEEEVKRPRTADLRIPLAQIQRRSAQLGVPAQVFIAARPGTVLAILGQRVKEKSPASGQNYLKEMTASFGFFDIEDCENNKNNNDNNI